VYSHLPYSLHGVAMFCCSEDEEYVDEDFFKVCETPGQLPVARWGPFRCLVLSELVINFCIKIRSNKDLMGHMAEKPPPGLAKQNTSSENEIPPLKTKYLL
jgi:hypothetical protein